MNNFYTMEQIVKPSAASTFNQTDFLLSSTQSSKTRVSKTRSFRAKLKNKILKSRKSISKHQQQRNTTNWDSYMSDEKCESNVVVTAICKIMNKSLGLFRSNTKKSKCQEKFQMPSIQLPQETSFLSLVNYEDETQCSISIDQSRCINNEYCSYNLTNYCVSTPKKTTNVYQRNNLEEAIYTMDKISMFNFSKDQSFTPAHSTPECHKKLLSPICVSSNDHSYSSSISTTTSSVSLISGNRLKSYGMTSSPISMNSIKNSIGTDSMSEDQDLSESFGNVGEFRGAVANEYEEARYVDLNQQKLISHLNNIKRNVRLSVELRNKQVNKRALYEVKGESCVTMNNKKRRLQKIFRSKIQRQLKEIKTWRIGFRNKLEVSEVTENVRYHRDYENCTDYNFCQNYYM